MKKAYFFLFLISMFSCAEQPENKETEKDFLNTIVGKWNLSEIKGFSSTDIKNLRIAPFIKFEENKISGTNGCNNFFSSITTISKNNISFSPFGETKMMCQEMKIPDTFGELISKTDMYFLKNNTLIFLNKKNENLLTFTKE